MWWGLVFSWADEWVQPGDVWGAVVVVCDPLDAVAEEAGAVVGGEDALPFGGLDRLESAVGFAACVGGADDLGGGVVVGAEVGVGGWVAGAELGEASFEFADDGVPVDLGHVGAAVGVGCAVAECWGWVGDEVPVVE